MRYPSIDSEDKIQRGLQEYCPETMTSGDSPQSQVKSYGTPIIIGVPGEEKIRTS
jgi:hypothetical protein